MGKTVKRLGSHVYEKEVMAKHHNLLKFWWARQDSNLGPTGYEPVALPTELWARMSAFKFYCG